MAATYSSLVGIAIDNKYEIRRVIGAGGMGVVCEAIHLGLSKRVAIKLIDKSMKESELIVARFRREARAAGQIDSEHIVDVFDVGMDHRVGLFIVMELLVGEDLQGRLDREGRLDVKTVVMIAHQIARGIARAHAAGVIHRDLKPANVFLTKRDNGQLLVKLLDFGVSKLLGDETASSKITGHGSPIGTPLYMAPEQAEGKEEIDGRADIWSLGALMYEALAGVPPFADRGSYHGTIVGILTSRPRLLHDVAPWVPVEVARVVDGMLVHDRNARIASAATVTERLLDAFPSVLPDGLEKYTAVIIPPSSATLDATADTEIFKASALGPAFAQPASSQPRGLGGRPSQPSLVYERDPVTMPDAARPSGPSLLTGAATPVGPSSTHDVGRAGGPITQPSADGGRRPERRTAPLPRSSSPPGYGGPISSVPGSGVSVISSGGAPASLAAQLEGPEPKAKRRSRFFSTFALVLAIGGVAAGGFFAGKRANQNVPAASPPPAAAGSSATSSVVQDPSLAQASSSAGAPGAASASSSAPPPRASGSTAKVSTAQPPVTGVRPSSDPPVAKKRTRPKPTPTAPVKWEDEPIPPPPVME